MSNFASTFNMRRHIEGMWLGHHTTAEAAAAAYNKYVADGIPPMSQRYNTSSFRGISWNKAACRWRAQCAKMYLGKAVQTRGLSRID